MSKPTTKQALSWVNYVVPVCLAHELPVNISAWTIRWFNEVRPGRGCDMDVTFVDGEHFAQVRIDVYGRTIISVAELDWVHVDGEYADDQPCPVCDSAVDGSGE